LETPAPFRSTSSRHSTSQDARDRRRAWCGHRRRSPPRHIAPGEVVHARRGRLPGQRQTTNPGPNLGRPNRRPDSVPVHGSGMTLVQAPTALRASASGLFWPPYRHRAMPLGEDDTFRHGTPLPLSVPVSDEDLDQGRHQPPPAISRSSFRQATLKSLIGSSRSRSKATRICSTVMVGLA
jgi:hypothetical protein